ncbi:albumin-like [Ranitomeya imitator]|uniref:albumin-like n=1 Tax=Ranitomeya imitator TaxID=111125 RepID=UPI0037E8411B
MTDTMNRCGRDDITAWLQLSGDERALRAAQEPERRELDILLGEICEIDSKTFINDQVHHCCIDSYLGRRPCFQNLGLDPSYKAPEIDVTHYKGRADICHGTEEEQKHKRLGLLIRVLKDKPDTPREKLHQINGKFNEIRVKCCEAEDRQACFDSERPDFHLQKLLLH